MNVVQVFCPFKLSGGCPNNDYGLYYTYFISRRFMPHDVHAMCSYPSNPMS